MPENTLRWLHLSDLHMKEEDIDQREIVFEALWKDIKNLIDKHGYPDFIVFTGDISMSSQPKEYELAWELFFHPLLKLCRKRKERLFIVPGNHDVNWKIVKNLKNPIAGIKSEEDLRAIIVDETEKKLRLQPMEGYRDFFNKHLAEKRKQVDPLFAPAWSIKKGKNRIVLVGLNSAWLSGYNRKKNNQVYDKNFLAIGESQIRENLKQCDGSSLAICLHHHPLEWLFDFDAEEVKRWMVKCFDLSLRGHLHVQDVLVQFNTMGNLISIPCGSIFDQRKSPNSYNMTQIDLKTGAGVVYFRRYNDGRAEWQKDIISTGSKLDGKKEFSVGSSTIARKYACQSSQPSSKINLNIVHTEGFDNDIKRLGLPKQKINAMVIKEFQGHENYLKWDTDNNPLTVQKNYIVFYSKIGRKVTLERAVKSTENQNKLYRWIKITDLYRECSRHSYRETPEKLFIIKGMLERVKTKHLEMISMIISYFYEFEKIEVNPLKREAAKLRSGPKETRQAKEIGDSVSAYLKGAQEALLSAGNVFKDHEDGLYDIKSASGLITGKLETSLTSLHKVLTEYPPVL